MREAEEKQRRAREAREKAEAERLARAERKRALVKFDMNADETQEGVMDSLMEALQNGSAFSRPVNRKRQTRAAGGKLKLIRNKSFIFKYAKKIRNLELSGQKQANNDKFEDSVGLKLRVELNSVIKEVCEIESSVEKNGLYSIKKFFSFRDKNKNFVENSEKTMHMTRNLRDDNFRMIVGKKPKRNSFIRQVVIERRRKITIKIKSGRYAKNSSSSSSFSAATDLITLSLSEKNSDSLTCNNLHSELKEKMHVSLLSKFIRKNLIDNKEQDENLNDSYKCYNNDQFDGVSSTDTILSTNSEKSRKLKKLFTFRDRKLLNESVQSDSSNYYNKDSSQSIEYVPQSENFKKSANWRIWKGIKNAGKIEIASKSSYIN